MKKFMKVFMPILSFFIFIGLPNQSFAQRIPIVAYGCPQDEAHGLNYRDFFDQIKECSFNTIYDNFNRADFNEAYSKTLRIIKPIYWPYCEGQTSIYESDTREPGPHFLHINIVGREVQDQYDKIARTGALNNYAWLATIGQDSAGYVQRGLLGNYNKEQNVLRENSSLYNPHVFYAYFRMRTPVTPDPPDEQVPIVKISAVLNNDTATNYELAARQVLYREFIDSNAVGNHYKDFRLRFQLTWDQEQAINREAASEGLDYRVY